MPSEPAAKDPRRSASRASTRIGSALAGAALLLLVAHAACAEEPDPLRAAVRTRLEDQEIARRSQAAVTAAADETRKAVREIGHLRGRLETLRAYDRKVSRLVASQAEELSGLREELGRLDATRRDLLPLMDRMLEGLERFVELDVPFLPEERRGRLARLRALMDRPSVPLAERFRRLMEAFQIESAYGRTVEAYRDELELPGGPRTVDLLRLGRVGLYYLSLDGRQAGMWDATTRRWRSLPGAHGPSLRRALRIARKAAPPDLLRLPVPPPGEVPR